MSIAPLIASIRRELRQLVSRKIYFATIVLVPVCFTAFFLDLMKEGLPLKVPAAVVDLDNSSLSRRMTRNLGAGELLEITERPASYAEALDMVKSGKVFGFFVIPEDFQQKAISGDGPEISFYSNMTVFVPGTLSYKGFMTTSVSTAAGLVRTSMVSRGLDQMMVDDLLEPMTVETNPLHNPWTNYAIYLSNSFVPGVLALMVMLVTCFSVTDELKRGTSPQWLSKAGGSITVAVSGKLLPQTIIFASIGIAMQAVFYRFCHFPLNNHAMHMIVAIVLLVIACQAFALSIVCIMPNMRMSMSVCSLIGILSFSVTGFSFPVEQMYPSIGVFAYLIPLRWYFLIYIDQALNGLPLYYSRIYYVILLAFVLAPMLGLWKLKRRCLNPVYVP